MPRFRPETVEVILPNARDGRPTRHVFIGLVDCEFRTAPGSAPSVSERARALIYRCQETGVDRRWGIIDVPKPKAADADADDGGGN